MLLLEANRVVALDRMIEDLWRGAPPPRALGAVHAYVSVLRRLIEPDRALRAPAARLVSQSPGYVLRAATGEVDALEFEALVVEGGGLLADGPAGAGARRGWWKGGTCGRPRRRRRRRGSVRRCPCGAGRWPPTSPPRRGWRLRRRG